MVKCRAIWTTNVGHYTEATLVTLFEMLWTGTPCFHTRTPKIERVCLEVQNEESDDEFTRLMQARQTIRCARVCVTVFLLAQANREGNQAESKSRRPSG